MSFPDERSPEELKHLYNLMLRLTHELATTVGERFDELRRRYPPLADDTLSSQNCETPCPSTSGGEQFPSVQITS
jgi:hypothetical protein